MSANCSSSPVPGCSRSMAIALRGDASRAWHVATMNVDGAAISARSRPTYARLSQLLISVLIAATVIIFLTNPGGAAEIKGSAHDQNLFAQCMSDWERATHMTKSEWAGACQRILRERGDSEQASQEIRSEGQRRLQ